MLPSKCFLLVVLVMPKVGLAVRSTALELDAASGDIDHLRVLYKFCFATALKQAAMTNEDGWPVITNDDDSNQEFDTIRGHWYLLRMSSIHCPIAMTDDPANQHNIPFSEVQDNFKDDSGKQVYEAYKGRPQKAWFEVSLGSEDRARVNTAVTELYKSAMRSKGSGFYIHDWVIDGECGSSASGEWKHERCHEVLAGKVDEGQIKFQASQSSGGSTIHIDNDGKETLDASEVFDDAFKESCKNTLNTMDSKFEGISSELCSGEKFYECKKNPTDTLSTEKCSNSYVGNVGWKDGKFYWK